MTAALAVVERRAARAAILDFVARVTKEGGPDYVPPAERIATFDNDGTLWCEQPLQMQVFFAHAAPEALAENDPALRERQPFKAFLEHDMARRSRSRQEGAVRGRRGDPCRA